MWLKCSVKIFKSHLRVIGTEKWNQAMTVSIRYPDTRIPNMQQGLLLTWFKDGNNLVLRWWSLYTLKWSPISQQVSHRTEMSCGQHCF